VQWLGSVVAAAYPPLSFKGVIGLLCFERRYADALNSYSAYSVDGACHGTQATSFPSRMSFATWSVDVEVSARIDSSPQTNSSAVPAMQPYNDTPAQTYQ